MKRYISDYHIVHSNALKFDSIPFSSLDEMHERIILNWNNTVNDGDEVYILGDFAWKNDAGLEVLKQLKGRKYLILGNHDRLNAELTGQFVWVKEMEIVRDGENHVVLCHYPIAHWRNADYGYIHLYGYTAISIWEEMQLHTRNTQQKWKKEISRMNAIMSVVWCLIWIIRREHLKK